MNTVFYDLGVVAFCFLVVFLLLKTIQSILDCVDGHISRRRILLRHTREIDILTSSVTRLDTSVNILQTMRIHSHEFTPIFAYKSTHGEIVFSINHSNAVSKDGIAYNYYAQL